MSATQSQPAANQQQELFSQDVINRKKTRDLIMQKLKDYLPEEGCKKPKIKAQHNDLVWVLVSMLNEEMIALRANGSRAYKHQIKHRLFNFATYKTNLIQQVANRNGTEPMGLTTLNRYLKLMQEAGLLLASNRKIRAEGADFETSQTTFTFSEKLILLQTSDEPKKAFFCSSYSPKKPANNSNNYNKNKINSDTANSNFKKNERFQKKGAVQDKTDAAAPVETANLSEKEKNCAKKEKEILNDGTIAGQLWAQILQTLYPNWNILPHSQREAIQIIDNLLENVAETLDTQYYQRVANGVEKAKEKQRELYRQADEIGQAKIMKNLQQSLDSTHRYFIENKPCAKTEAFLLISRAIQKAQKYQDAKGFTLNIYPTKYLANNFIKAVDWAHKEYNQNSRHRQAEDMKQLAAARALHNRLFKQIAVVRFTKNKPEISQSENMQGKYDQARREFVAHIQTKCQQLTDDNQKSLLQAFDDQIATALLARSKAPKPKIQQQPDHTTSPHTDTADQHNNTAAYDVRSEGENFQSTDWEKQNEYDEVLRLIDEFFDELPLRPMTIATVNREFSKLLALAKNADNKIQLQDYIKERVAKDYTPPKNI